MLADGDVGVGAAHLRQTELMLAALNIKEFRPALERLALCRQHVRNLARASSVSVRGWGGKVGGAE